MGAAGPFFLIFPPDGFFMIGIPLQISPDEGGLWGQKATVIRGNNLRNGRSMICRMYSVYPTV
jgi:hypothetical protein